MLYVSNSWFEICELRTTYYKGVWMVHPLDYQLVMKKKWVRPLNNPTQTFNSSHPIYKRGTRPLSLERYKLIKAHFLLQF